MKSDLKIAIEDAVLADEFEAELAESISALSDDRQYTILILLDAYKEAVVNAELQWRSLEQREDFKAQYSDRTHARNNFLLQHFRR